MLRRHTLELTDQLAVSAERKLGLDQVLERSQPQLLQSPALELGPIQIGEIGKRTAPPERKGFSEERARVVRPIGGECGTALRNELLEPREVEMVGHEVECVSRPVSPDSVDLRSLTARE